MQEHRVQVVVIGGGIAGLWTLNRLCQAGYDAVLLEQSALGGAQTLASQGIIHGGLKYALNGVLSPASSAIADMPDRWRRCLHGEGDLDLRDVKVLSPHYFMWSGASARSRLKTFLGSRMLRGRIDALSPAEYPHWLTDTASGKAPRGTLYKLNDFVIDTPSLLEVLTRPWQTRIYQAPLIRLETDSHTESDEQVVITGDDTDARRIITQRIVLCAGAGNEALLKSTKTDHAPAMQRRPLHMLFAVTQQQTPAFMHCIGDDFGMTPRLTITVHPVRNRPGFQAWYLGGELAESGVGLSSEAQVTRAKERLNEVLPWFDTSDAEWHSLLVDRAEPRLPDLKRPDTAFVERINNTVVCWPTKLTLTPDLADQVLQALADLKPSGMHIDAGSRISELAHVHVAPAPWESVHD